jgi:hypothetical protein
MEWPVWLRLKLSGTENTTTAAKVAKKINHYGN